MEIRRHKIGVRNKHSDRGGTSMEKPEFSMDDLLVLISTFKGEFIIHIESWEGESKDETDG